MSRRTLRTRTKQVSYVVDVDDSDDYQSSDSDDVYEPSDDVYEPSDDEDREDQEDSDDAKEYQVEARYYQVEPRRRSRGPSVNQDDIEDDSEDDELDLEPLNVTTSRGYTKKDAPAISLFLFIAFIVMVVVNRFYTPRPDIGFQVGNFMDDERASRFALVEGLCIAHPLKMSSTLDMPRTTDINKMVECLRTHRYGVIPIEFNRRLDSIIVVDREDGHGGKLTRYVPFRPETATREDVYLDTQLGKAFGRLYAGTHTNLLEDYTELSLDPFYERAWPMHNQYKSKDLIRSSNYVTKMQFTGDWEALDYLTRRDRSEIAPCLRTMRDANIKSEGGPHGPRRCTHRTRVMIEKIDALFDGAPRLQKDLILWRGIRINVPDKHMYWQEDSYVFATPWRPLAEKYKGQDGHLLKLTIPKGTPLLSYGAHSSTGDMDEVVLPRGGSLVIKSIKGKSIYATYVSTATRQVVY